MSNGGANAQRGFIFQSIIAMIECLERDNWDEIKIEPATKLDKVDFVLRRNGSILSAEQVKSRQSAFGDKDVKEWLEELKRDAPGAEEYCLCLVGDSFTGDCKDYIEKHRKEITTVSFKYLQDICTGKLAGYVRKKGLGERVTLDDLDLIDDSLFAKIHRNSISGRPMSRAFFEAAFQRVIPVRKTDRNQPVLPIIRNEIDDPCETFVEGAVRSEDLVNIESLLRKSRKPLWLHGEGGIGKTELVLYFAKTHPEYEYIFIKYAGSINQTVSKDIFILPDYESGGRELNEEERYHVNYDVFRQYAVQLKQENRNLVLIIDNYCLQDYETELREQTDMDIYNGFAGVDNDLKELDSLIKTGIHIVLTTRVEPQHSDIFNAYEIKKMREEDLLKVMAGCFTRIRPYLGDEGIRDKLLRLIRIAESWTVYVTAVAGIMQESEKGPMESLDTLLEMFGPDKKYRAEYLKESLQMQNILEKVLGFVGLSYQEKQVLMILTMLPDEGMEYEFYQKLTTSNAVHLNRLRRMALERLIKTRIVIRDQHQKGNQQNGRGGKVTLLRMHPIIADHAQKILIGRDIKAFLNSIKSNWVNKLVHYFDDESIKDMKIDDQDYRYVPLLAIACSTTEQKLKELEKSFRYSTEEIAASRESLLICASKMSNKVGNVKDALEYTERAIAVDGPSSKNMKILFDRSYSAGGVFYQGGKYPEAKHYYLNCLQILNNQNFIVLEDIDCPEKYKINKLIQSEDVHYYVMVLHSLGNLYATMKDYGKALEYDLKTLAIVEQVLGAEHHITAVIHNSIGNVYEGIGDYEKSLEYYNKALAIKKRVLGNEHPSTAVTYNNIGSVYVNMGDYDKALEFYRKDLDITEQVLGLEHSSTAVTYQSIGGVYKRMGDYGNALEYYRKALDIQERMLGTKHPSTAETYYGIGDVYQGRGDYENALKYYQKALNVHQIALGEECPHTKIIRENIVHPKQGMN